MSEKRFRVMNNDSKQLYCIESVDGEMFSNQEVVELLNEQQEQLNLYKEAILTMLGLLADKGIIFSGVKDE